MSEAGDKNAYWCPECHGYTVVVHRDAGVTPMFLACRANGDPGSAANDCKGMARSVMYPPEPWPERDGYGNAIPTEPTYEWFTPSPRKLREYQRTNPGMADHIERGGLDLRPLQGASR